MPSTTAAALAAAAVFFSYSAVSRVTASSVSSQAGGILCSVYIGRADKGGARFYVTYAYDSFSVLSVRIYGRVGGIHFRQGYALPRIYLSSQRRQLMNCDSRYIRTYVASITFVHILASIYTYHTTPSPLLAPLYWHLLLVYTFRGVSRFRRFPRWG